MIHDVLIVFGQEKASTPDISKLDSKFYLHGIKSLGGGVLGVVTMTVRRSASRGGFLHYREAISIFADGNNPQGLVVSSATENYSQCNNLTGLIKNLKGGTIQKEGGKKGQKSADSRRKLETSFRGCSAVGLNSADLLTKTQSSLLLWSSGGQLFLTIGSGGNPRERRQHQGPFRSSVAFSS